MSLIGSIIKKIIPGGLKKKLFDMAIDGGLKRLVVWIKSKFSLSTTSENKPSVPAITKTSDAVKILQKRMLEKKQKPKTKRPRF